MNKTYIVFNFVGQGFPWNKKNLYLYYKDEYFKNEMNILDEKIKEKYGFSTIEKVLKIVEKDENVTDQILIHFMNFIFQIPLFNLLCQERKPDIITGISLGEIPALYCSGILDFDQVIYTLFWRGTFLNKTLHLENYHCFLFLNEQQLIEKSYYKPKEDDLEIVGYVTPSSIIINGKEKEIDNLVENLENDKVFCKKLENKSVFHTSKMEFLKDEILKLKIIPNKPSIKYISQANLKIFEVDSNNNGSEVSSKDSYYEINESFLYENIRNPFKLEGVYKTIFNQLENDENINKLIIYDMCGFNLGSNNLLVSHFTPILKTNKFSIENIITLPSDQLTNSNDIIKQYNNIL